MGKEREIPLTTHGFHYATLNSHFFNRFVLLPPTGK
jgi:hypothetical protein